jgi:hypothetical protein
MIISVLLFLKFSFISGKFRLSLTLVFDVILNAFFIIATFYFSFYLNIVSYGIGLSLIPLNKMNGLLFYFLSYI